MKLKYDVVIPKHTKQPKTNGCNEMITRFATSGSKTAEVMFQGAYKNAASGCTVFRDAIKKLGLSEEVGCLVRGNRLFLEKKESSEEALMDDDFQEDPVYLTEDDIDLDAIIGGAYEF